MLNRIGANIGSCSFCSSKNTNLVNDGKFSWVECTEDECQTEGEMRSDKTNNDRDKSVTILEYLNNVRGCKQNVGYIDSEENTESMRNKGAYRMPEKRELLKRIHERTKSSDKKVKSYF